MALSGCGQAIPTSLSLDPLFTESEVAAAKDARDQWCATDGWCPSWSFDGEAHIVRDIVTEPLPPPGTHMVGGRERTSDGDAHVDGRILDADPSMAWVILAHEMGHLQGIDHHGKPGCTMFWFQPESRFELTCED